MADRSVRVVLSAVVSGYTAQMRNAQKATQDFTSKASSWVQKHEQSISTLSNTAGVLGLAMTAAAGAAVKAAIDWETAWAGVLKTVDGTPEQLAAVEEGLRGLAKELPASHAEIAAVAEAAGQLGIATDDVVDFTRTMIDLGETTNLTADEAATALARISNIMGTSASDVDRMGATIVDLGNNAATTEREIVELSTRLAAAGRQAGLTEADVFAIASALTSVGVEAEAGGSAMSKVFTAIADATRDGGDNLETFARVAGVTVEEFRRAFEEDAAGAIGMFVEGMGRLSAEGQSTSQVFKDLGLTDQRLMRAVLSVGSATGLWADQLELAGVAWEENTALADEAAKRYETVASQVQIAWNNITDAAIEFGAVALPLVADLASAVSGLAQWFGALPGPIKTAMMALTGGGGLVLLGIAGLGKLVISINAARVAMQTLGISARTASIAVGAVAGVLAVATIGVTAWASANAAAKQRADEYRDTLNDTTGAITDQTDALLRQRLAQAQVADNQFVFIKSSESLIDMAERMGITIDELVGYIYGEADAIDAVREKMSGYVAEQGLASNILETRQLHVREVEDALNGEADAIERAKEITEAKNRIDREAADRAREHGDAAGLATEAIEGLASATSGADEALQEWVKTVRESNDAFVDIQGAYDAVMAKNEELGRSTKVTAASYIKELERQVEAQRKWQDNLISISERVNESMTGSMRETANAMIDELVKLGPKGAEQVRLLESMSDKELARVVELYGMRGDEAGGMYAEELASRLARTRPPEIDIEANTGPADGEVRRFMNRSRAMSISVSANTSRAAAQLRSLFAGQSIPVGIRAPGMAAGGPVSGPGTSTSDSIPAWLSNGEYVIRASAVQQYGRGFLDAINAQRFAMGGYVEPKRFAVGGYASVSTASATSRAPSLAGLHIEGTLDLGGGLVGTVRGVVRDELSEEGRRRLAGQGAR